MPDYLLRYICFFLWMAFISACALFAYIVLFDVLRHWIVSLVDIGSIPSESWSELKSNAVMVAVRVLEIVAGTLVWWRAVKVVVLHGSPLPIGVTIMEGRENEGKTGRLVSRVCIGDDNVYAGDYKSKFWYGSVFRAHPNSDKLMRSRLEFFVMALPFGCSLVVHESRIFLKMDSHKARAKRFRLASDKYSRIDERMRPDKFRSEVTRHLHSVGRYFEGRNNSKRIDGLNWHFYVGGGGFIADDFGYRISFKYLDDKRSYKVTDLGPKADGERVVSSIDELRGIAKTELTPLP